MLFMQMLDDIVILRIINGSDFFCIFHAEFDASTVVYSSTGGQALAERLCLRLSTMLSNHVMHFLFLQEQKMKTMLIVSRPGAR